eukprot:scaffold1644_cov147-Skeletonema_dohrnii-CCMP3373.AAC.5
MAKGKSRSKAAPNVKTAVGTAALLAAGASAKGLRGSGADNTEVVVASAHISSKQGLNDDPPPSNLKVVERVVAETTPFQMIRQERSMEEYAIADETEAATEAGEDKKKEKKVVKKSKDKKKDKKKDKDGKKKGYVDEKYLNLNGEKAHRHHPQQSPYHTYLLHLTQPAERKNDLTATLHSGVDVREVSGLHKQKTKPNSNRRTVEPLSSSFSSQSATLKKIELYSIPIIFFPISSSS